MKYADFKSHQIKRTCKKVYNSLSGYRPYLEKDFHGRCCYCNMPQKLITSPFHIDHFVPRKEFKGKRDSFETDYENLMWSCPKCNLSKGDQYAGDVASDPGISNELFYNPVETDYNDIFYRNEYGGIDSDDEKGKEMIRRLKLYRPVHNLAWLVEHLEIMYGKLNAAIEQETDEEKKELLVSAKYKMADIYMEKAQAFRAAYNSREISK